MESNLHEGCTGKQPQPEPITSTVKLILCATNIENRHSHSTLTDLLYLTFVMPHHAISLLCGVSVALALLTCGSGIVCNQHTGRARSPSIPDSSMEQPSRGSALSTRICMRVSKLSFLFHLEPSPDNNTDTTIKCLTKRRTVQKTNRKTSRGTHTKLIME